EIALVGKAPDRARAVDLLARGWPDGARIDEHESALELAGAIGAGERRPRAIVVVAADPSAALESLRALRDALSSHHIAIVVLARGGVPSLAEERELL